MKEPISRDDYQRVLDYIKDDWLLEGDDARIIESAFAAAMLASSPPSPDRYREGLEAAAKIADGFTCGACGMDGKVAAAIRSLTPPAPDASGGQDGAAEATQPEVLKFVREYICDGDSEEIAEYAGHLAAFINQRQTGKQDGAVEVSTYGNAAGHLAIKRAADALLREVADHLPKPDASGGQDGAAEYPALDPIVADARRTLTALRDWFARYPGGGWLEYDHQAHLLDAALAMVEEAVGVPLDESRASRLPTRDGAAEERARAVKWLREEAKMRRRLLAEGPTAVVASYNRTRAIALDAAADTIEAGDHLPKPEAPMPWAPIQP